MNQASWMKKDKLYRAIVAVAHLVAGIGDAFAPFARAALYHLVCMYANLSRRRDARLDG